MINKPIIYHLYFPTNPVNKQFLEVVWITTGEITVGIAMYSSKDTFCMAKDRVVARLKHSNLNEFQKVGLRACLIEADP
jgi:hypothetical protein